VRPLSPPQPNLWPGPDRLRPTTSCLSRSAGKKALGSLARRTPRESQNRDRLAPPPTDRGTIRNLRFSFADVHNRLQPGGWARQVTIREMPIANDLAIVNMRLKAGAVRELHWHNETEWGFVLNGQMGITAIDEEGHAQGGALDLRVGRARPARHVSGRRRRAGRQPI
jgi:Cupin